MRIIEICSGQMSELYWSIRSDDAASDAVCYISHTKNGSIFQTCARQYGNTPCAKSVIIHVFPYIQSYVELITSNIVISVVIVGKYVSLLCDCLKVYNTNRLGAMQSQAFQCEYYQLFVCIYVYILYIFDLIILKKNVPTMLRANLYMQLYYVYICILMVWFMMCISVHIYVRCIFYIKKYMSVCWCAWEYMQLHIKSSVKCWDPKYWMDELKKKQTIIVSAYVVLYRMAPKAEKNAPFIQLMRVSAVYMYMYLCYVCVGVPRIYSVVKCVYYSIWSTLTHTYIHIYMFVSIFNNIAFNIAQRTHTLVMCVYYIIL